MKLSRRNFNLGLAGIAGAAMVGQGRPALAARDSELNILVLGRLQHGQCAWAFS